MRRDWSVTSMSSPPPIYHLELLQNGQEFFPALIKAIQSARHTVSLETYIFDFQGAGASVANALIEAAKRGVRVRVLVDGIGTGDINLSWVERFKEAGVHWHVYSPLAGFLAGLGLLLPKYWRRLHRKLCVIDERILFCGGINVLDDFYDPHHGTLNAARLDFSVAITGPIALVAQHAMDALWWRLSLNLRHLHLFRAWHAIKVRRRASVAPKVALVLRDNVLHRASIEQAYRKAIGSAHDEIVIANAYFMPGGKLKRALVKAAHRGVKVRLLVQGKYENFLQYHAAPAVYAPLLKAGVEIYEYEPSFLHAKVAVIDGVWSTVGSSNLDPLSLLLAREANVVIEDTAFANQLRAHLSAAIEQHGRRMNQGSYANRPWTVRVLDKLACAMVRSALWLTGSRY